MYMSPVAEMLEIRMPQLMAGSIKEDGDNVEITVPNDPQPGDAGDAAAPGFNPAKLLWTIVLMLVMTLTANAQTVATVDPAGPPADGKTHGMKI